MPQRKSACKLGQACPAFFVSAKSTEAEKAGTTQHSAKQCPQSARRSGRSPAEAGSAYSCFSDNICTLSHWHSGLLNSSPNIDCVEHVNNACLPGDLAGSTTMHGLFYSLSGRKTICSGKISCSAWQPGTWQGHSRGGQPAGSGRFFGGSGI